MAHELFNNLSIRLVGDDESPISEALAEKCLFFKNACPFQLDRVVGPAAPTLKKGNSIGELWDDIAPINRGFQIDLAAQLPYYLPQFAGAPDYSVQIGETELFVSTRMIRCFFQAQNSSEGMLSGRHKPEDEQYGGANSSRLNYWLVHRLALQRLVKKKGLQQIHPIPMGTFVAKRLFARAQSAESAIQDNLYGWVEEMANEVSRLLEAIRTTNPVKCKHLPPIVTATSFPTYFLVVTGANDKSRFDQFAPRSDQFGFRSITNLDGKELRTVREYLKSEQPIPVEDYAIGLALTFLHQGYQHLALVQICIACESVLARQYRDFLLGRGVSRNKYQECERDVTFSHLLNLHLPSMVNISALEDHDKVLAQLNWARKRRNEIVHEGRTACTISADETTAAIDATRKLVAFLCAHSWRDQSSVSSERA